MLPCLGSHAGSSPASIANYYPRVAKLVNAVDSKSIGENLVSSSLTMRTIMRL